MKLHDLLIDDWIAVPMDARELEDALRVLLGQMAQSGVLTDDRARKLARDLACGAAGEVVRVNDRVALVLGRVETLEDLSVSLGVSAHPFRITPEGREPAEFAQAVVVLLTPRSL